MLTHGNTKLGDGIWSFSIPAISTCPGSTELCRSLCYATGGNFLHTSVRKSYAANLEATKRKDFTDKVVAEIQKRKLAVVRIHVSGDFYSIGYIRKWTNIVAACPDTTFFVFTRSWRVKRLLPALMTLAKAPNLHIWWSVDRETGPAPQHDDIAGDAYMAYDDSDEPSWPVGLVFRDKVESVMKYTPNGYFVCTYEQGIKHTRKMTCTRCKFCFNPKPLARQPEARAGRLALPLV